MCTMYTEDKSRNAASQRIRPPSPQDGPRFSVVPDPECSLAAWARVRRWLILILGLPKSAVQGWASRPTKIFGLSVNGFGLFQEVFGSELLCESTYSRGRSRRHATQQGGRTLRQLWGIWEAVRTRLAGKQAKSSKRERGRQETICFPPKTKKSKKRLAFEKKSGHETPRKPSASGPPGRCPISRGNWMPRRQPYAGSE